MVSQSQKISSVAFFLGMIFFAGGIFLPNSFDIEVSPGAEACIAIFPIPKECLPTVINGWFAIGVSLFLIGGYHFVKYSKVTWKDITGLGK